MLRAEGNGHFPGGRRRSQRDGVGAGRSCRKWKSRTSQRSPAGRPSSYTYQAK